MLIEGVKKKTGKYQKLRTLESKFDSVFLYKNKFFNIQNMCVNLKLSISKNIVFFQFKL